MRNEDRTLQHSWFGKIPNHWQIKRNKEIFAEVTMPSKTGQETLLTVSHITGVTPRSEKNVNMFMADDMTGYKQCQPGDLVINTMWAWMGALGTSKYDGICSPAYGVYRPRRGVDYHAGYFDYLFRTPSAIMEMTRYSKGIVSSRLRLYPKDFYQIDTCLPPFAEQKAIADYLDKQLSLLDQKITLLNRKIEKHQELKKSLINEVICRGLNPNAPLIDSKIDWLGKIPQHWDLKRLKDFGNYGLVNGLFKKKDFFGSGVKIINVSDIYQENSIINVETLDRVIVSDFEENKFDAKNGDIFFVRSSIKLDGVGASALLEKSNEKIVFECHVMKFRPSKYIIAAYLKDLLGAYSFRGKIVSLSNMVTMATLSQEKILSMEVICPPLEEQEAIAAYLDEKTGAIDAIVAKLKEQVGMLQVLRKTLISEVVTGKLKVVDNVQH